MDRIVDLIVVSYNSSAVLGSLLDSAPSDAHVIVVDNCSSDSSVAVAQDAGAEVVAINENVGYGRACNIAVDTGAAPFLLIVNPDTALADGAIDAFISAAALHPNAAFNPRFYSGGRRRFKGRSRLLAKSEFWNGKPPETDCDIPVLHGSCIFIRREHFELIGGFNSNIFLFHEDDDLVCGCVRPGWNCALPWRQWSIMRRGIQVRGHRVSEASKGRPWADRSSM